MSRDNDKDDVTNPPKQRPIIHLPKPARPTPTREPHRPEAMTPPPAKKDESVVR